MIITAISLEGYYLQLNDIYKYNDSRNLDAPTLLHNHYDDHKVLRSRTNYSLDQRTSVPISLSPGVCYDYVTDFRLP